MKDYNQKVIDMKSEFEEVKSSLDVDKKKERLKKLESKTTEENFWDDQERARKIMQEVGNIKSEVESIEKLDEDLVTLSKLAEEGELDSGFKNEIKRVEIALKKLKLSSFLSGDYDGKNAIVSIHAGQGGTEAMDWTSMLYRMYINFCKSRDWDTKVIDMSEGEEAGIKSVTFKVVGHYAFGYLKNEAGTHRLVRQSPFNADKLRQTSFALVEVLPELEEVDIPDIKIDDDDLEWQFFRASTQGGQNVQKVSSAVRLKHKPTAITVTAQTERYQEQNRKYALELLRSKLWAKARQEAKEKKREIKGEYQPASWGTQIRSYVLHPYKMVKDLRTNVKTGDTDSVLDGQLDEFIQAEIMLNE
jgi:peptide chain release factor 2